MAAYVVAHAAWKLWARKGAEFSLLGLIISVLQVATQLQEMTLSYVPKMLVAAIVLLVLGPWMIYRITQFAIEMILLIPSLG